MAASDSFVGRVGFGVGEAVDRALGLPNWLVNDANAFLMGELTCGVGQGLTAAAGLTLGTGVGGALYCDGRLLGGLTGAAGELGHYPEFVAAGCDPEPCTCGGVGHLESLAAGQAIARRYTRRTGVEPDLGARGVANAARAGDADAQVVLYQAGQAVGQLAAHLAAVVDIRTLIVGGGVATAWDLLEGGYQAYLTKHPPVDGADPVSSQ